MSQASLSVQEILNQLLLGNKVVMTFPNVEEANKFKKALAVAKMREQRKLLALGLQEETLILKYSKPEETDSGIKITISSQEQKLFAVEILPANEKEDGK